jgi:carbon storage regulator CsrA
MLVLSRREQETIVLPAIRTTIQLLKVRGQVARLGIGAPDCVQVLRGEIAQEPRFGDANEADLLEQLRASRQEIHALRDRLNEASVAAHFARKLLDGGQIENARMAIGSIQQAIQANRPSDCSSANDAARQRPRTLLVEDNPNERQLMAGVLRASGFEVHVAGDGAEALSCLSNDVRPDVVLMDMMMPRCDGATAVRQIRSTPSLAGLRIFAITGTSQGDFGLETGPRGVDRWYSKPLDPAHLVDDLTRELQVAT